MCYTRVQGLSNIYTKSACRCGLLCKCEGLSNLSDKQCRVGVVCFARVLKA